MSGTQRHPACPYPGLPPPMPLRLTVIPDHQCPYIPGRTSRTRAFAADDFPPDLYHRFMDAGFRRSGDIFYQPICPRCRACLPIRVPADRFAASKSQRRCWRRNQDLQVSVGPPEPTDEKHALYCDYVLRRHGSTSDQDREAFDSLFYKSPVRTLEICYRDPAGKLLGVGICDLCAQSLSSVYFYFDPAEARRGLGTFSALMELEIARRGEIPWYYLGYWIKGCRAMEYKSAYRPCELLHPDGVWRESV